MFKRNARTVLLLTLVILVAGCGKVEPTATPVPPGLLRLLLCRPVRRSSYGHACAPDRRADRSAHLHPCSATACRSQPSPEPAVSGNSWRKTYGGTRNTVSGDLLLADDGGFFVVGTTNLQFEPEQLGDVYC